MFSPLHHSQGYRFAQSSPPFLPFDTLLFTTKLSQRRREHELPTNEIRYSEYSLGVDVYYYCKRRKLQSDADLDVEWRVPDRDKRTF